MSKTNDSWTSRCHLEPALVFLLRFPHASVLHSQPPQGWIVHERLTTVFPRQGHYALDAEHVAKYPAADITVERIGDILGLGSF